MNRKTNQRKRSTLFIVTAAFAATSYAGVQTEYTAKLLHSFDTSDMSAALAAAGGNQGGIMPENGLHAAMWIGGEATAWVDMHPSPDYFRTVIRSMHGNTQVGSGFPDLGEHALLWQGTAASCVDLHPWPDLQTFSASVAFGVHGDMQVGVATGPAIGFADHAFLWTGTSASAVDLHPEEYMNSEARAVWKNVQVGRVEKSGDVFHAAFWNGSAESFVDLHPTVLRFDNSTLNNVHETSQVGYLFGFDGEQNQQHAALWEGTAASAIDLHPVGYSHSTGVDVYQGKQIGWGFSIADDNAGHALLWSGSAQSVIDLHDALSDLPFPFVQSEAVAFDKTTGDIVGIAYDEFFTPYAVMWTPIATSCPPDVADNGSKNEPDGIVNIFDLLMLLDNWGTDGPGAAIANPTDVVDVFDLLDLLSAWGEC